MTKVYFLNKRVTTEPLEQSEVWDVFEGYGQVPCATFYDQISASDYVRRMNMSADERWNAALGELTHQYDQTVRSMALMINEELESRIAEQECGELLREWLLEYIHESIDGSSTVIYTREAIICLLASNNDGAYLDEFGADGATDGSTLNWSALAFSAFRADVIERLDRMGVDVNNPVPNCDLCSEEDQEERYKVDGDWICSSCKENSEEPEEEDEPEEVEDKPE